MRFIQVVAYHSEQEVNDIISQLHPVQKQLLGKMYDSFEHVQYVDYLPKSVEYTSMYAVMSEFTMQELAKMYVRLNVKLRFKFIDITEKVLFGETLQIPKEGREEGEFIQLQVQLLDMIDKYLDDFLKIDNILDKISEKGSDSLTERDRKLLGG